MSIVRNVRIWCAVAVVLTASAGWVAAQTSDAQAAGHQHEVQSTGQEDHAAHDVAQMAREGSGTAWLPDESPMYAIHAMRGPWSVMFHENAFLQFLHESGPRGDDQTGSINWLMGMAQRNAGPGRLGLRGMFSFEPWSIRGCGYPDLLATGEECEGQKVHDRQHPHDLFMELAADYSAPIVGDMRWQVYAGPAGEPALGPVAYPHRVSALPNPLAPIAHHWLDSTHITYGVVTGALYGRKWKAETSVFNGREPDEERTDFDFAALDSVSGRLWVMPMPRLALQISAGHLKAAEAGEAGGSRIDVDRVTASATYHRMFRDNSIWATTVAWGRNAEPKHASNALLVETNVTVNQRDTLYGRFEVVGKTAHDLVVSESLGDDFAIAKIQGGYTRYLPAWNGFQPGVGAGLSLAIVPETLKPAYGSRANTGFAVYVTLRPAAMIHPTGAAGASATGATSVHVMVQTALDPAKLACLPAIEPKRAVTAIYQGTTYYFCSAKERDEFLTNPAMSLKMMPPKQ
jgi:YHS domain-containing protein